MLSLLPLMMMIAMKKMMMMGAGDEEINYCRCFSIAVSANIIIMGTTRSLVIWPGAPQINGPLNMITYLFIFETRLR